MRTRFFVATKDPLPPLGEQLVWCFYTIRSRQWTTLLSALGLLLFKQEA